MAPTNITPAVGRYTARNPPNTYASGDEMTERQNVQRAIRFPMTNAVLAPTYTPLTSDYYLVYTGPSTAAWTLPPASANDGLELVIVNRTMHTLTIAGCEAGLITLSTQYSYCRVAAIQGAWDTVT